MQKFENTLMSGQEKVLVGKCPVGEASVGEVQVGKLVGWGIVYQVSVSRGTE